MRLLNVPCEDKKNLTQVGEGGVTCKIIKVTENSVESIVCSVHAACDYINELNSVKYIVQGYGYYPEMIDTILRKIKK